ncbi:cyclase family protein, partial [Clostridioides difficile]|nr:cyclase family protein [Clostridioides difficile]
PETPHWTGFPAMEVEPFYLLDRGDGFNVNKYTLVTQYGTHVDAPIHFVADRKYLDEYTPMDMVLPLCVIDKSNEVAKNSDYVVTVEDIQAWEKEYGNIPEGAFVAFRSDWSKRPDDSLDNYDSDGNKHFPGWSIEALQYMVEKRNIAAIGHETCDT